MVDAGLIVIVAFISPFAASARWRGRLVEPDEFFEVYVDAPLHVAEARTRKACTRRRGEGNSRISPASTRRMSRRRTLISALTRHPSIRRKPPRRSSTLRLRLA